MGDGAPAGWERGTVPRLLAGEVAGAAFQELFIGEPIDRLGDLWPVMSASHRALVPGGRCTLFRAAGRGPAFADVANLFSLTGFLPERRARVAGGRLLPALARPQSGRRLTCSVIVPCRNEVGNVEALVRRIPDLGAGCEILFVDGASTDGTAEAVARQIAEHPQRAIRLLHQGEGRGKAAAVFQGFDAAEGEVVMILDADLAVAPEDLHRFHDAIAEGSAEFANGSRFVYPMDTRAMRALNGVGNRAFASLLSRLLKTRITDSLCGTKAMRRSDWHRMGAVRQRLGGHDPWGDFDLLLAAGALGLAIRDIPVVYHARVAGESKMHRFAHGAVLARTCLAGVVELRLRRRARRAL